MAKRARVYKTVNTFSKNMGSSGNQVLIVTIDKLDAQGITGYLNNVQVSAIINNYDGGDTTPGIMFYLTSDNTWDENYVITAAATAVAGKVFLSAKRRIVQNSDNALGNIGLVHLWAELTDITALDNISVRYVVETWGRYCVCTPVP